MAKHRADEQPDGRSTSQRREAERQAYDAKHGTRGTAKDHGKIGQHRDRSTGGDHS